jgi:drug/metabolite transporter (DMT)-like permease
MAILGERPGAFAVAGAALIFLAVYLVVRRTAQAPESSATRASNSAPSGSTASSMSKPAE